MLYSARFDQTHQDSSWNYSSFFIFFPLYVNFPLHVHLQSLKGKEVEKKGENIFVDL